MSCSLRFVIFCSILLVLLAPKAETQEYIFNHLTSRDGLLSNNILALCQTKDGYLWVGTENGLQRYDGYHFANPASAALSRPIDQILQAGNGTIWIRMGNTIGTFDAAHFTFNEVKVDEPVAGLPPGAFTLSQDQRQHIFLILRGGKCFYPDAQDKILSNKYCPFKVPEGWKIISVNDDTLAGRFWINTDRGLGYFDKAKKEFYDHENNPSQHILLTDEDITTGLINFYIDSKRRYWIEKWDPQRLRKKYFCYSESENRFTRDTLGLSRSGNHGYYDIYRFMEFNDTTVLIYGLNCMSMRENGAFVKFLYPYYSPFGIDFNIVHDVLEDREDILWIATDNGLYNTMANINDNRHLTLPKENGNPSINCLLQDQEKNIWIGTWGNGVMVLDSNLNSRKEISAAFQQKDEAHKLTWAIHQQTRSGTIWIGYQQGYLDLYDPVKKTARHFHPEIFGNSTIRNLEEDPEGRIWLGLQNGKLFYCTVEDTQTLVFREIQKFDGFISKLKLDKKGSLWIAVAGHGLYQLDTKTNKIVSTYNTSSLNPLSGNDIRDLAFLNDSIYMLAGDQLERLNIIDGSVRHISRYDNAPLGKVLAVQLDPDKNCWFTTVNGIYRYNYLSGNIIRYTQWDGLITPFNNSFILETGLPLRDGNLIFAGNQSLVSFAPSRYKKIGVPPNVRITDFQLLNTFLPVDSLLALKAIQLDYEQKSFTIQFASLSFTQLEKLIYEYKLEGADADWIAMKAVQPVKYSLLPPGHYRFLVRAVNTEGVYTANTTAIFIVIAPPFWKSYWFFVLVAMALGGLLYYLHQLRLQRLLQVEKVRIKLARDLHDDMGSTLSTINILTNLALQHSSLGKPVPGNFLTRISESTIQMMESMDDIIWSINPLNDSIGKVLARMKQVAGTTLESKGIEYLFIADEPVRQISFTMEWRREIFLIFKEAINNILKYANCSNVRVKLEKQASFFILQIQDNGIGFNPGNAAGITPTRGNGLINMQKRAAQMKGTLSIESGTGNGTSIILRVPLT